MTVAQTLSLRGDTLRFSRADAARAAGEWLAGPNPPRAIYTSTDEQAFGVLFTAYIHNLSVP